METSDCDMMQSRAAHLPVVTVFRGLFRYPLTHAGLFFALAVLFTGIAALISANNLLFLIVAAMISTFMVSGLISRLSLAALELDCVLPPHIAARTRLAGKLYVRNAKRWLPSFSVHLSGSEESVLTTLYFPVIPSRAVLEETVEVWFRRRGVYRENGFQFSTSFPFGFLERRADVTLRREVIVYPSIDPQPGFEEILAEARGELVTPYRGRGHDFYRIRPYEAFESARHVDWKATAHTGELQVREFVREQDRLLEVFLDLNVPPSELDWFEQAVDACAFLAWRMAERGARICFRSQLFEASIPEMGDVYTILKYLASVAPAQKQRTLAPEDENSYQIVFTAGDPEAFVEAGWYQARFIRPGTLPRPGGAA
jgi:uncharacterized protein (DUF58 family)